VTFPACLAEGVFFCQGDKLVLTDKVYAISSYKADQLTKEERTFFQNVVRNIT
jgi:hypothetical protein